jgi:hypothetical protein
MAASFERVMLLCGLQMRTANGTEMDDTHLLPARGAPAAAVLDEEVTGAHLARPLRCLGRANKGSGLVFRKLGRCVPT